MPRQWILNLAAEPQRPLAWRFDVLHAIACAVFEQSGSAHDAADKPFAVRTHADHPRQITLTWLDDRKPPAPHIPERVEVGDETIPVADVLETTHGYDQIESTPPTIELRFVMWTPTLFRHNGHNYPLPDPYVTFASLARRYRTYRPHRALDDDITKELAKSTMVAWHRIKTQRFSWHGRTDSGFTGHVAFRIAARAERPIHKMFGTLGAFAELAGMGRGTTHGLGATTPLS
ncbi:CRISPR-associated endoribonuclease Cas6 [Actinomadura pelletieri DSM 43383]|uniref:CRISPR-associated endoribonuclease Cas6 n=2 Tax=Actinomadura pelletieri TaxID=111805 RepID=A0A495Q9T9_9ACTN|nr:CRISPR-associated endoribonuclease Cas6 [Actinomadura pelletieri DSM 43383]